MNHADHLMSAVFAALDRRDENERWWADEVGVERCEFVRAEEHCIVVRWKDVEMKIPTRSVFANPTDAHTCHEMLRSNAEARCYEPIERD